MQGTDVSPILVQMFQNIVSVGYTTSSNRGAGDGKVSSTLFGTSLIAAMAACIFTYKDMSLRSDTAAILYILLALLILSTILWTAFLILNFCRPNLFIVTVTEKNRSTSLICSLLWIFGLGVMLYQLLNIIIDFKCSREDHDNNSSITYLQSGLDRMVHVFFVFIQLLTITCLSNCVFKSNIFVNYSLSIILLTNVAMWAFKSSRVLFNRINKQVIGNETNLSPEQQCYWNSTIQTLVLQKTNAIFTSLLTNSSLLSVCIITDMLPNKFPSCVPNVSAWNDEDQTDHNDSLLQGSCSRGRQNPARGIHRSSVVFLVLALITFLPCLVLFVWNFFENIFTNFTKAVFWMGFSTLSMLFMTIAILYCFRVSRNSPHITGDILHTGLLRNPFLSILFSLGDISHCMFVILSSGDHVFKYFLSFKYLTEIMQVYFQTILMIDLTTEYKVNRTLTRGSCAFLMCGNLLFWVFSEYSRNLNDPTRYFDTQWFSVKEIVFPILSFYRLYSFMYFSRYTLR